MCMCVLKRYFHSYGIGILGMLSFKINTKPARHNYLYLEGCSTKKFTSKLCNLGVGEIMQWLRTLFQADVLREPTCWVPSAPPATLRVSGDPKGTGEHLTLGPELNGIICFSTTTPNSHRRSCLDRLWYMVVTRTTRI